jgi:hypothetical protein
MQFGAPGQFVLGNAGFLTPFFMTRPNRCLRLGLSWVCVIGIAVPIDDIWQGLELIHVWLAMIHLKTGC